MAGEFGPNPLFELHQEFSAHTGDAISLPQPDKKGISHTVELITGGRIVFGSKKEQGVPFNPLYTTARRRQRR